MTGSGDERGAAAVEAALLIPLLVFLLMACVCGWRVWWAHSQVTAAASGAARLVSLQRSPGVAQTKAAALVNADLTTSGVVCASSLVEVDDAALAQAPGITGEVSVAVTCRVGLSDLLLPGVPGTITVTSSATERVDTFRERVA